MTKREKAKLRKAVEESWASGVYGLDAFCAIDGVCDECCTAAFRRWRQRDNAIGIKRYSSTRIQSAKFKASDFRFLKEIGA